MRTLGFLAAAAGLAVSGTQAADLIIDHPAAIEAAANYDWSGLYVGAFGGYGWGDLVLTLDTPPAVEIPSVDGALAGVRLGANAQSGALVFGAEADLSKTWMSDGVSVPSVPADTEFLAKLEWLATATGRVGYAADTALFYGKAGLAAGEVEVTETPPVGPAGSASNVALGWTAGLGVEFALEENFSVGAEYDYVALQGSLDMPGLLVDPDHEQTAHIVTFGVNYGF